MRFNPSNSIAKYDEAPVSDAAAYAVLAAMAALIVDNTRSVL